MIKVSFSPRDIKAQKLLDPGPYGFIVEDVGTKRNPKGQTQYYIDFVGFTGMAKDVPLRKVFNEEWLQFMVPLMDKGFGITMDEDNGTDIDLEAIKTRKIKLFIKRGNFNGQDNNDIEGFEPWTEEAA